MHERFINYNLMQHATLHLLDPLDAAHNRHARRQSPRTRCQQLVFALDGIDFCTITFYSATRRAIPDLFNSHGQEAADFPPSNFLLPDRFIVLVIVLGFVFFLDFFAVAVFGFGHRLRFLLDF